MNFCRMSVLRKQLEQYKSIISSRIAPDQPVITYQDNMQIMRTSLRHLRLSKLHKEKLKQEKVWDFTVRGWRAADTSGIEEYFQAPKTAAQPQGEVSKMKYKDTKLGRYFSLRMHGLSVLKALAIIAYSIQIQKLLKKQLKDETETTFGL